MSDAPKQIFLIAHDPNYRPFSTRRVHRGQTGYVRADIHAAVETERDRLRDALEIAEEGPSNNPHVRPRIVAVLASFVPHKTWKAYSPERRDLAPTYAETERAAVDAFRAALKADEGHKDG